MRAAAGTVVKVEDEDDLMPEFFELQGERQHAAQAFGVYYVDNDVILWAEKDATGDFFFVADGQEGVSAGGVMNFDAGELGAGAGGDFDGGAGVV